MGRMIDPTPISYNKVDLTWLIGLPVGEVSYLEPTLWRFFFGPQNHIGVECLWRVIKGGRVVLTREDHGQLFGLPTALDAVQRAAVLLSGVEVTAIQLREATADILIDFGGNLRLEVIPDSSGYESWQVYAPGGVCFVAQGGGQICTWTQ